MTQKSEMFMLEINEDLSWTVIRVLKDQNIFTNLRVVAQIFLPISITMAKKKFWSTAFRLLFSRYRDQNVRLLANPPLMLKLGSLIFIAGKIFTRKTFKLTLTSRMCSQNDVSLQYVSDNWGVDWAANALLRSRALRYLA